MTVTPAELTRVVRANLNDIVGGPNVLVDRDERASYEVDWTGRFSGATPAVVRPATVAEVAAVVAVCRHEQIAIVAQGGNTGLVGGGVPLAGELVLSLGRMTTIDAVDVAARQITVAAGACLADVHAAATAAGLAYAVDFAARGSATIGGTVATNAGGINVLRHGSTREQLVGVEAVLGSGQTISRLAGLVKDNTGYHFPSLLCGSEGTLGILTAVRLRLVTRHDERVTALLAFADVGAAIAAVGELRSMLESLVAAELFLDAGMRLVCEAFDIRRPFAAPHPVYLLIEAADTHDPTSSVAAAVESLGGVRDVAVAADEAQRAVLWRYREDHTSAINRLGAPHKLDVTLPIDRLATFVETIPSVVGEIAPTAQTWLFGHVGDGNIHVNISGLDPDNETVDELVLEHVAALRGSISAEHGIGTAKKRWLHLSRSSAEIEAMRAIKQALDPDGILNPNVLFP